MSTEFNVGDARAHSLRMGTRIAGGRFAILLLCILAVVLLTVNLTTYPTPWFDEGYFMAVARMVAQDGIYGLPDSSGPWVLDPSITSGPTLIVPLALVFKLFGVGLIQARALALLIAGITLGVYALLARRLVGGTAAIVALAMLLAGNPELYTSFAMLARQALGEVAAFGLCLYGVWLWLRALDTVGGSPTGASPAWWRLACAGLALGLAVVTKPQMVILVVPMLLLACLVDRLYYRQASWAAYIIPAIALGACQALWMAGQVWMLGINDFLVHSAVLQAGVRSNIIGFDLVHIRHALATLATSGFVVWGLPGLCYGLWLARTRDRQGLAHAWLVLLVVVGLAWFTLLSIGWPRYAFVPLAILPIWSARLICDLLRDLRNPQRVLLILVFGGVLLSNARPQIEAIVGEQNNDAAVFSAYLAAYVPHDAVVASWEWNLDTSAPQQFYHPSPLVMYQVIDLMQRDLTPPADLYDPSPGRPEYVINGPFSVWTGIYQRYITAHTEPVVTIGGYSLHRVIR